MFQLIIILFHSICFRFIVHHLPHSSEVVDELQFTDSRIIWVALPTSVHEVPDPILLEAEFSFCLYGASVHRAFHPSQHST